jgi:hypothetical protein
VRYRSKNARIPRRLGSYIQKKKSGWHIPTLGHNIEDAFRTGNRYVRVAVHDMESHNLIACFYHTPVTRQLRKQGEKLGDFVHAQRYRSPEDQWWDKLRTHLTQTGEALRLANTGTLLGPPMMRGTSVEMNSELPPGRDITSPMPEGCTASLESATRCPCQTR